MDKGVSGQDVQSTKKYIGFSGQDRHNLVDGEGGVVGLHHGVGHLGGGNDRVGVHDPVRVLLTDLQQGNIFFLNLALKMQKPTLEMRRVPMPEPVPPPREWVSWKPCRQSHPSASFLKGLK